MIVRIEPRDEVRRAVPQPLVQRVDDAAILARDDVNAPVVARHFREDGGRLVG